MIQFQFFGLLLPEFTYSMTYTPFKIPFSDNLFRLRLPFRRRKTWAGSGITKEDEFRLAFSYLDANSDGKISADELRSYFAKIGDGVTAEEAEELIRACGGGEVSVLELPEFVKMMELRDEDEECKTGVLKEAFEVYAAGDGSAGGCITAQGLRRVLQRLGIKKSCRQCREIIRAFDLDGNGVLDFYEFHAMMT